MPHAAIRERWVPVRRKGRSSFFVCIFYTDGDGILHNGGKSLDPVDRATGYAAGAIELSGHDPKTVLVQLVLPDCIVRSVGRSPSIRSSSLALASVLGC